MALTCLYEKIINILWLMGTLGYVSQFKSQPLMFLLLSPIIVPGSIFMAFMTWLFLFEAVFVLSGCGITLLMLAAPAVILIPGPLVLGIVFVCTCYGVYKGFLLGFCVLRSVTKSTRQGFTCSIDLVHGACHRLVHVCGLFLQKILLYFARRILVPISWTCICFAIDMVFLFVFYGPPCVLENSRHALAYCIDLVYFVFQLAVHLGGLVFYAILYVMLNVPRLILAQITWTWRKVMKKDLLVVSFPCNLWCWLVSGKDGQQFCTTTLADKVLEVQDKISQNSTEILEKMESKTTGVMEKAEQRKSTIEPSHAAATTNQQVSREQAIENIRRSILTTSLTKENVKDVWLEKQSRRGRRRWSRRSNNAISVSLSPMSKEW